MHQLDRKDKQILAVLQEAGRISNAELAERVHLSPSACLRRVKALEEGGVIAGYAALLDPRTIGRGTDTFVEITLKSQAEDALDAFEQAVERTPEIMECYLMAGDADYLLRVSTSGPADYERIHREVLARMPGVARLRSIFALRTVCKRTAFPL